MNQVESQTDYEGPVFRCPLTEVKLGKMRKRGEQKRPYSTHHGLLMHANECLEILDHEYSASGGFMSILPTEEEYDTEQLAAARNSLVGQWLLFNQHLVSRLHELEISFGNALDLLAGEAIVPMQMLSRIESEGNSGCQVAYPQDKWVLVNAGDDVFDHLHHIMDRQEAQIEQKADTYKKLGMTGEASWKQDRGGEWHERGMVPIDIMTRYYRIKEQGRSNIFILPAWEHHPGVQGTRRIEERPTVVSVVTPTWPQRVSDWEKRNQEKLDDAESQELIIEGLIKDKTTREAQISLLSKELAKANFSVRKYESMYGQDQVEHFQAMLKELNDMRAKMADLKQALPDEYLHLLD